MGPCCDGFYKNAQGARQNRDPCTWVNTARACRPTPGRSGSFYLNCAYAGSSLPRPCADKSSMVLAKPLSRILYVDDDASMRELVRTALAGQSEFTVVTCASGFEALIIVGQLRPDLILLDVAMPRLDGVQTLECLRAMELGHHTPVVFVAAGLSPLELQAVAGGRRCRRHPGAVRSGRAAAADPLDLEPHRRLTLDCGPMRTWLRRTLVTFAVLLALAGAAYYWLIVESHMPGDASYALDIDRVRAAARDGARRQAERDRGRTGRSVHVPRDGGRRRRRLGRTARSPCIRIDWSIRTARSSSTPR